MTKLHKWTMGLVALLMLVGLWGAQPLPLQALQGGPNLLTNPGFEAPYNGGVANGWAPWHEDSGEKCSTKPSDWDFVCLPSWSDEGDYSNLGLKHGGSASQHVGAQFITWHGGVFQTVSVPPGSRVRFTVFGYGRASNEQPPAASMGSNWVPRMRVGIDPEGKGLWYDGGIVWSGEVNTADSWVAFSVEATAGASGKVSVYVDNKFRTVQPVAHMDVWWDDATLSVVGGSAATATSAPQATTIPPTVGPPPTPRPTATPRADGAVVYVVQSGDTLGGIAYQYNVTIDQIKSLNNIGADNMIVVGQELVISGKAVVAPTATSQPVVQPTPQPPAGTTPQAPAGTTPQAPAGTTPQAPVGTTPQAPAAGGLCLVAFNDRNADTYRQGDSEELIPGVVFAVSSSAGIVATYTSNGFDEPYCVPNLQNGNYRVSAQPPTGYNLSGPGDLAFIFTGNQLDIGFGVKRADGAAPAQQTPGAQPQVTATPTGNEVTNSSNSMQDILGWIVKIAAGVVGVLLVIILFLFVRARMMR